MPPPQDNPPEAAEIHSTIHLLIKALTTLSPTPPALLQHLPSGATVDTKSWNGWDWTQGIGLYGLWNYYTLTSSPFPHSIIQKWFHEHLSVGTEKNVNTMAVFLTLAYLYDETGEEGYRAYLEEWGTWAMEVLPRTKGGGMQHVTYEGPNLGELWDDTLFMTALPLAKIGLVLGRREWVEEAKRQFEVHVRFLRDEGTGLWFHGWKFEGEGGHNFARARWGRGNAWVVMGVVEIVEMVGGEDDAFRREMLEVLRSLCEALKACQTEEGGWRTLLDVSEEEGSYIEASATAGIACGMLKAVRLGLIGTEYREVARKGVQAVKGRIGEDGVVRDVSFGTAIGSSLRHYLEIPKMAMPYGQALAVMALVEELRVVEGKGSG